MTVAWRLGVLAFIVLLGGCAQPRKADVEQEMPIAVRNAMALVADIRQFEHSIGFAETDNFRHFSAETEGFPFCGHVSRLYLPYSYEDPAIHWIDSISEQECRAYGEKDDVFYDTSEALGERSSPITTSMLAAPLDRFVYLVIHEDCHDQFDFPSGIEEALCSVISYRAMAAFAERRAASMSIDYAAIGRYAREQAERSRMVNAFYDQLAALYWRYYRKRISPQTLMRERDAIYSMAERALGRGKGAMNNVTIANDMTYSRHYGFLESVFHRLGDDLGRSVAFFKHVDALKPHITDLTRKRGFSGGTSVALISAYEIALLETIEKSLNDPAVR